MFSKSSASYSSHPDSCAILFTLSSRGSPHVSGILKGGKFRKKSNDDLWLKLILSAISATIEEKFQDLGNTKRVILLFCQIHFSSGSNFFPNRKLPQFSLQRNRKGFAFQEVLCCFQLHVSFLIYKKYKISGLLYKIIILINKVVVCLYRCSIIQVFSPGVHLISVVGTIIA